MMKPVKRIGINLTKRCSWECLHCFYRHEKDFNENYHRPLDEVKDEIQAGKNGGCTAVICIGFGEPMLYPDIFKLAAWVKSIGMSFSIITNGTAPISKYEELNYCGIDHYHLSVHALGDTLNEIAGNKSAARKQLQFMKQLKIWNKPWRSNTTIQQKNFRQLPDITRQVAFFGCRHFVVLGFLPHYHWQNKLKEVAVHPKDLQVYIEVAVDNALRKGMYVTIRYQPMCHLSPDYWKYVVNARYVPYDPFEWCYNEVWPEMPADDHWRNACSLGDSVAIKGEPCISCALQLHCGGWNRTYADAFDGADLKPIYGWQMPDEYKELTHRKGGIHDCNPVNSLDGTIK